MLELLITTVAAIGLAFLFYSLLSDAVWFTLHVTQPLLHAFQRVFLGIDEVRAGPEMLIGQQAVVIRGFSGQTMEVFSDGIVRIEGELWRARLASDAQSLEKGQLVTVTERAGLTLTIEPGTDP